MFINIMCFCFVHYFKNPLTCLCSFSPENTITIWKYFKRIDFPQRIYFTNNPEKKTDHNIAKVYTEAFVSQLIKKKKTHQKNGIFHFQSKHQHDHIGPALRPLLYFKTSTDQ